MDHYFMCWLSEKPVHPGRSFLQSSSNSLSRLWALIAALLFSKYQMPDNCSQTEADMWVLLQDRLVAQISLLGISHACTFSVGFLGGWRLLSCLSALGNATGMLLNPWVGIHLLWSQLWDRSHPLHVYACMGQWLGIRPELQDFELTWLFFCWKWLFFCWSIMTTEWVCYVESCIFGVLTVVCHQIQREISWFC